MPLVAADDLAVILQVAADIDFDSHLFGPLAQKKNLRLRLNWDHLSRPFAYFIQWLFSLVSTT